MICKECYKEFKPQSKQPHIKFCSKICRETFHLRKMRQDSLITYYKIFIRDSFTCIYCGKSSIEDNIKLVIDHIFPRKIKIDNDINNLVTACTKCNSSKNSTLLPSGILMRIQNTVKSRNKVSINNIEAKLITTKLEKKYKKLPIKNKK